MTIAPQDSIVRLLMDTMRPENFIAKGKGARTYRFTQPGMEAYILRVEEVNREVDHPEFIERAQAALGQVKAFAPSRKIAQDIEVGQEILVGSHGTYHFSVRQKQQGVSLKDVATKTIKLSGNSHYDVAMSLLEKFFEHHPEGSANPLKGLLGTIARIANSGFEPDTNPANVLFDGANGSIGLVDQFVRRLQPSPQATGRELDNAARQLKQYFTYNRAVTQMKERQPERDFSAYDALAVRFNALVDEALLDVKKNVGSKAKLTFAKVDATQAVAASEQVNALQVSLDKLTHRSTRRG